MIRSFGNRQILGSAIKCKRYILQATLPAPDISTDIIRVRESVALLDPRLSRHVSLGVNCHPQHAIATCPLSRHETRPYPFSPLLSANQRRSAVIGPAKASRLSASLLSRLRECVLSLAGATVCCSKGRCRRKKRTRRRNEMKIWKNLNFPRSFPLIHHPLR